MLAAHVSPPPIRVADKDLSRVHTIRGIRLGQTIREIESIDGVSTQHTVKGYDDMVMLSYFHKTVPGKSNCVEVQNFGFHNGRLVYIDFTQGC